MITFNSWVIIVLVASTLMHIPSSRAQCPFKTECLDFTYKGADIEDCIDDDTINRMIEICMEDNSKSDQNIFVVNEIGVIRQRFLRTLTIPSRRLQGGCRKCGGGGSPPPDCCRRRDQMLETAESFMEPESSTPLKDSGAYDEIVIARCLCNISNFYLEKCGRTISECKFIFCG